MSQETLSLTEVVLMAEVLLICKDTVTFIYIKLQTGVLEMYTTTDERGILNNYATEPVVYLAAPPSPEQKRRYVLQGALAVMLVALTLLTAVAVS